MPNFAVTSVSKRNIRSASSELPSVPRSIGPRMINGKPARRQGPTTLGEEDFHYYVITHYARSPGPIYNVSDSITVTQPNVHVPKIGIDGRVKYFVKTTPSPGVGAYKPPAMPPEMIIEPIITFPKGKRDTFGTLNNLAKPNFFGQFHTLPDPGVISTHESDLKASFTKDDRTKYFVRRTPSPGVGAYKPPIMPPEKTIEPIISFTKGKRDTFGTLNNLAKPNFFGQFHTLPDPGVVSTHESDLKASFTKDDRVKHFVGTTPSPGVGAYKPPAMPLDKTIEPIITFPKGKRDTFGTLNNLAKPNFFGQFHTLPDPAITSSQQRPRSAAFTKDDRVKHFFRRTSSPGVGAYKTTPMVGVKPSYKSGGTFPLHHRDCSEGFYHDI
ncbi:MAG: hypothetical protein EZS28_026143 [Streblomastix strix]|uniref:Uncharacterized protein n=1 Tax=Streblomastix strix TaxID=222440 RepID=A0A5J4V687_9EUKA|nr:MAG: hypothetical protein EZS28_026143 [Streblomastix strix]